MATATQNEPYTAGDDFKAGYATILLLRNSLWSCAETTARLAVAQQIQSCHLLCQDAPGFLRAMPVQYVKTMSTSRILVR
jgi:hypothetical protein